VENTGRVVVGVGDGRAEGEFVALEEGVVDAVGDVVGVGAFWLTGMLGAAEELLREPVKVNPRTTTLMAMTAARTIEITALCAVSKTPRSSYQLQGTAFF
jgi:hypothetical protein